MTRLQNEFVTRGHPLSDRSHRELPALTIPSSTSAPAPARTAIVLMSLGRASIRALIRDCLKFRDPHPCKEGSIGRIAFTKSLRAGTQISLALFLPT